MKEGEESWLSWADFFGTNIGYDGNWSKKSKLEIIHELEDTDLVYMEPFELLTIINQGNLPEELTQLLNTDAGTDARLVTIQEIIERLEDNPDEPMVDPDVEQTESIVDQIIRTENRVDSEITDDEDDEPVLPSLNNSVEPFHSLDNQIYASMDDEAIESLIRYKFHKLWDKVLNENLSVETIRQEEGGQYFTRIQQLFLGEYDEVSTYKPVGDYRFKFQPNLMQKLITYRFLKNKFYGNWSGTGAGKTLSYIIASREIDARVTMVIVVNSTVDQACQDIKNVYADSVTYTDYDNGFVFDRNKHNYLILNYEKFQQTYSEEKFQNLTNNNQIDFVVIDEVHNSKRRENAAESIRRGVLTRLLGRIRENNPNLYTLAMSATPVINDLFEAKSLLTLLSGLEYKDIETRRSINNAMKVYQQLHLNGLRYIPKYDINVKELTGKNTPDLKIDGTHLFDSILDIPVSRVLDIEQTLLKDKLIAIEPYIRKGVVIYTHYVEGMINPIKDTVEKLGFKPGFYTGDESPEFKKIMFNDFLAGRVDVLIASDPITTGVDHLQEVCDRMILITLPWTDSVYTQLKGRIFRQGSLFTSVEFIIPQVVIELEGEEQEFWSWDIQRLNLIKRKRTLADAAVDGLIPSKILPTADTLLKQSKESLLLWKERIKNNDIYSVFRNRLMVDLYPEIDNDEVREQRITSELSEFNRRGKTTLSSTMNKEFNDNPESWFRYHSLRRERMKDWSEIPYEYIATKIRNNNDVIADFGCGDNKFKDCVPNNEVYSFDHIACDDSVIACDMKDVSAHLEDESIDTAVFSLALWGTNYKDYIKEAFRVLKHRGFIYIAEPIKSYETPEEEQELYDLIRNEGFEIIGSIERRNKFIYITGIKF